MPATIRVLMRKNGGYGASQPNFKEEKLSLRNAADSKQHKGSPFFRSPDTFFRKISENGFLGC